MIKVCVEKSLGLAESEFLEADDGLWLFLVNGTKEVRAGGGEGNVGWSRLVAH